VSRENSVSSTAEKPEQLSVIVPCLNEEGAIRAAVQEVVDARPKFPVSIEIVIVDDGSTDNTRQVAEQLCEEFEDCRLMVNGRNLGVGRSVMLAYETIPDDNWVTCFPGDRELVFESLLNYMDVRHDYDLILGYFQNPVIRPTIRRVASSAFTLTARFLYGYRYQYLNGLKMYRRWVFKNIDVISNGHAINAELIAKAMLRHPGLRIGEAPFVGRGRPSGSSKAFRPSSIVRAMRETMAGYRSVTDYRREVVKNRD
jgi:glycosyltransferase involved in cell wall biosynthesis